MVGAAAGRDARGRAEEVSQRPVVADAMLTPPSRTVNDLVGFSEPLVGSTARPSVSSDSTPSSGSSQSAMTDGARRLAVADLDHDDANLRLDAPAVGEDDHLFPWKACYSEPIRLSHRSRYAAASMPYSASFSWRCWRYMPMSSAALEMLP